MALKRMVLEIGMGTDIRGADSTKAAERAVRDALWHNTLSIATLMGKERSDMHLEINIGVPRPETVNKEAVLAVAPYGRGVVKVVDGGLENHIIVSVVMLVENVKKFQVEQAVSILNTLCIEPEIPLFGLRQRIYEADQLICL